MMRLIYGMAVAPLDEGLKRVLCNTDPRRYELDWRLTYLDGLREVWWVRKYPGPRGAAGALYRVVAPPHNRVDLPHHWIGTVQCDCPEAQNGAQRLGGLCKHSLMVYAWQGSYYDNPARWLYLDVYLRKFCAGDHTDTTHEVHHG
jgi:hypothetical protein